MVFSGAIYHERQQSESGHYTSRIQMDNTWLFISDIRVLRQKKFQCNSRDISVACTQIYEKRNNLLIPLSSLLNNTAGKISSDSTLDVMISNLLLKN